MPPVSGPRARVFGPRTVVRTSTHEEVQVTEAGYSAADGCCRVQAPTEALGQLPNRGVRRDDPSERWAFTPRVSPTPGHEREEQVLFVLDELCHAADDIQLVHQRVIILHDENIFGVQQQKIMRSGEQRDGDGKGEFLHHQGSIFRVKTVTYENLLILFVIYTL